MTTASPSLLTLITFLALLSGCSETKQSPGTSDVGTQTGDLIEAIRVEAPAPAAPEEAPASGAQDPSLEPEFLPPAEPAPERRIQPRTKSPELPAGITIIEVDDLEPLE